MGEHYSGSKIRNANTFWEEVADLGIHRYAGVRRVNGKQKMCLDLFHEKFEEKLSSLYKDLEVNPWIHLELKEFSESIEKFGSPEFQN